MFSRRSKGGTGGGGEISQREKKGRKEVASGDHSHTVVL